MTETITVPDVEAIEHLDWKPACESKPCGHGRPPATHIIYYLRLPPCGCFSATHLICSSCVEQIASYPDLPFWRCTQCHAPVYGHKAEVWRIEPLP